METTLSGFDASFLASETPSTPMHTLKVIVLERDPNFRRPTRAWIRNGLRRAVDLLPALRVRPRPSPFGLGHPSWEEVPVDIDRHVRFETLWPLGGRTVEDAIAEHVQDLLPRDRPLFDVLVIERAGSAKVTVAVKYHHALADGMGSGRMLEVLAGAAPAVPYEPPPRLGLARSLLGLFALLVASVRGLARSMRLPQTVPFAGRGRAWNAPVTPTRRLGMASLPLDAIQRARQAAGSDARPTINDVLLTLVASALREVAPEDGDAPLVAAQPVAVGDVVHDRGNHLSTMFVPVHVEAPDPAAALRRTSASTLAAKAAHAARGHELVMRWSHFTPAPLLRLAWRIIAAVPRPPAHLVVSNIPGSRSELRLGGARVESVHLVGPLLPTTGLNVTFWSHAGAIHVCAMSAGGIDPRALAAAIRDALERLLEPSRAGVDRAA